MCLSDFRFPDKDRFTSSLPDFVLVTPIAAKTQKQQTNVGGWVLQSGRGQLRETGRTPAAPPATNPRQHRPKDLSKPRRDIHLVEIKYCEDTRPQNQLSTVQKQLRYLKAPSFKEPPLLSTHNPVGSGRHHLQQSHNITSQGFGSRVSETCFQAPNASVTYAANLSMPGA